MVESLFPLPTPFEDSDSLLEETDTLLSHSDDSSPDYETFFFDIKEKSSSNTTSHSDHSILDYEAFCFDVDHIEEKSSGSTASHSDLSLLEYESFHFDLSISFLLSIGVIFIMRSSSTNSLTSYLYQRTGNSFTYDTIQESYDEVPNPLPQYHFNIYLCQICESNSHYGYECSQRVPLVYEPEPCYTQNFNDNDYSHDLPGQEEKRIKEEQAAKAQNSKIPVCYDDDDDYNSTITPNEPIDSLSMGDEHLDTILATESDEFIKSCVETLVSSESEGENGCDVLACFTTFSNVLFEADYESDSNQHHFNVESDLIESMLNRDSSIISSSLKIDSLLDEFAGELTLLKSIPPGIDKTDCYPEEDIRLTKRLLYHNSSPRPPEEFVFENSNAEIESFSPSPIPNEDSDSFMEEIDLFLTPDDLVSPGIEEDDDDSERDMLILEELPSNYSLSLSVNELFYFDILSFSRPPAKSPDSDT
nr:hypothetical protein [Tanacetum cinerariifolium]